jgi:uncharacterized membrane protein
MTLHGFASALAFVTLTALISTAIIGWVFLVVDHVDSFALQGVCILTPVFLALLIALTVALS